MKQKSKLAAVLIVAAVVAPLVGFGAACGKTGLNGTFGGAGGGSSTGQDSGADGGVTGPGVSLGPLPDGGQTTPANCSGLQCQIHACADGGTTTISGKVFDPAGKNPLYNVVVYVPNSTPKPLTTGASCDSCNSLYTGDPIATAVTGADGTFSLSSAPDGANIPLVIQVGKWRQQVTLSTVAPCIENKQADGTLTLPKNHTVGDIPSIAISTGGADSLECLLRRIGIEASEYGSGTGAGRIHIFQGTNGTTITGAAPTTDASTATSSSATLWDSKSDLMAYDIVLLSCEGDETANTTLQSLVDYTTAGGRVFASHFHYAWFNTGAFGNNLATWTAGTNDMRDQTNPGVDAISANVVTTLLDGGTFTKGQALQTWLTTTKALTSGELLIFQPKHNADVGVSDTPSQPWLSADSDASTLFDQGPNHYVSTPGATMYFSFNTPVDAGVGDSGAPAYCGRVVYSDLHVGAVAGQAADYAAQVGTSAAPVGGITPDGCVDRDLSAQEKALEFMLFDLLSCVTPDSLPPPPPPSPTPPPVR